MTQQSVSVQQVLSDRWPFPPPPATGVEMAAP